MSDSTSSISNNDLVSSYSDRLIFINPETYIDEQAAKALEDIILKKSVSLNLDNNLASLSYGEKQNTISFFETVLDQPPHMSHDHDKIRRFLIDWYSSHKSLITKSKKILDLNLLTNDELNELILGFGFPYPRNILSKSHKIQFLSSLVDLYKKKGTAFTLWSILTLYGLTEVVISEWWVRHDERKHPSIFVRSKPIYPEKYRTNTELIQEKTLEEFTSDPYWQQSKNEIVQAFNNKENKISLPSITPYISIQAYSNLADLELALSVVQRKIYETLRFWISNTLIPVDLNELGIVEVWQEIPILNSPPTKFPSNEEVEDYITKNVLYVVGPDPEEGSVFEGHARELAKRLVDSSGNVTWDFTQIVAGIGFIARKDSEVAANKLVKFDIEDGTNRVLQVYSPSKNAVIQETESYFFTDRRKTSYVFNGEEWQRLDYVIPSDLLKNNLKKDIYRDIALNGFSSVYSPLEVALAISYLNNGYYKSVQVEPFEGSTKIATDILENFSSLDFNEDTKINYEEALTKIPYLTPEQFEKIDSLGLIGDNALTKAELLAAIRFKKHLFYNGDHAPLDYEPYDNIDDTMKQSIPYGTIINEYDKLYDRDIRKDGNLTTLTYRHISPKYSYNSILRPGHNETDPHFLINDKRKQAESKYTKTCVPDGDHELGPQQNPKYYLKALNPEFFKEIQEKLYNDPDILLEEMMSDFESYLIDDMGILNSPFTYVQTGGTFLNRKVKPVIDFFKPFRVRLLDFLTSFKIDNPLMDSMIPGDNNTVGASINQLFYDKPFPLDFNVQKTFISSIIETFDMTILKEDIPATPAETGTCTITYEPNNERFKIEVLLNFDPYFYAFYYGSQALSNTLIKYGPISSSDIVNNKITLYLSRAQFLTYQTSDHTINLDVYDQSQRGINGVTGDVGSRFANIYTRVPVLDNGLPMDEICVVGTKMIFGDVFSSPIGDITQGKVLSEDSSSYIAQVDRNLFDVNMKDNTFIKITDKDPDDTGATLYEYTINIEDNEETSSSVDMIFSPDTIGNTNLTSVFSDPESYDYTGNSVIGRVSFDESSNDFNINITTNEYPMFGYIVMGIDENLILEPDFTLPQEIYGSPRYDATFSIDRTQYYTLLNTFSDYYIVVVFVVGDDLKYTATYINPALDYISAQYP